MEPFQELFTLEYSSSEEDIEDHPCRFNIEDFPICISHLHYKVLRQDVKHPLLLQVM